MSFASDDSMEDIIAFEQQSITDAWCDAQRQLRDAAMAVVTARDSRVRLPSRLRALGIMLTSLT